MYLFSNGNRTYKLSSRTKMLPLNVNVNVIGQPTVTAHFRWRARLAFYFYGNGNGFTFTVRHRELYSLVVYCMSFIRSTQMYRYFIKISNNENKCPCNTCCTYGNCCNLVNIFLTPSPFLSTCFMDVPNSTVKFYHSSNSI